LPLDLVPTPGLPIRLRRPDSRMALQQSNPDLYSHVRVVIFIIVWLYSTQ
jgi:hypothetical protein